jgi:hypothetical protein
VEKGIGGELEWGISLLQGCGTPHDSRRGREDPQYLLHCGENRGLDRCPRVWNLVSEGASFITGEVLDMNGGYFMD